MRPQRALDVLIVSLGSTSGLRAADSELHDSLERAGASVAVAAAIAPASMRTLMLTDLAWALAARAAATRAIELHRPRAIVYSSTTAALLRPRQGAIRFDAPAAGNRPGRHGLWQRPLERRRLAQASLLLPWSAGALAETASSASAARSLVLPVPVERSGALQTQRDIAAITYAANPSKKGLDRVLAAWRDMHAAASSEELGELVVAGVSGEELTAAGIDVSRERGVRVAGRLSRTDYRALVRRARVFLCAPRREDYGIAQLEALADGCVLVTTPAPGPYVALDIARKLDPRFVSEDLGHALRAALEAPQGDYPARAEEALARFTSAAVDGIVARELLPRLLASASV